MSGRKTQKEIKRRMNKMICSLRRRASHLQDENSQLQYRHQLLAEMCDGFELFRQMQYHLIHESAVVAGAAGSESRAGLSCNMDPSDLCTDDELQLLQQLQSLPPAKLPVWDCLQSAQPTRTNSSSSMTDTSSEAPTTEEGRASSAAAAAVPMTAATAAPGQRLIAPPNDSLWVLKQMLMCQSPEIDVSGMTLPQLIDICRATVRELSLALVHSEAGLAGHHWGTMLGQHPDDRIQQIMMEHWRMIRVLCTDRPELVTMLQLVNTDTGEVMPEPDRQRAAFVLKQLNLSYEQEQRIAQGAALFKQLLSPVLEELRQMQQQQNPASQTGDPTCKTGQPSNSICSSRGRDAPTCAAAAAAGHAGDVSVPVADEDWLSMPRVFAHGRMLEQQQERSKRITTLLRKDHFMRTWFASYLYGCLSWTQVARMHVLLSPMYPVPYVFYTEVAKHVACRQGNKAKASEAEAAV